MFILNKVFKEKYNQKYQHLLGCIYCQRCNLGIVSFPYLLLMLWLFFLVAAGTWTLNECAYRLTMYWLIKYNLQDIIGPYWSLRAALAPVLETYILLDRLLFLQEQGSSLEAVMLPVFDPVLSPRNVAIIAKKPKSWHK